MVKCRCFSILMPPSHPPFQCCRCQGSYTLGRDYSNIEIGGRGFDLELVSGAQKTPQIWLQRLGPARLLHSVVNNSCGFHPQWKVVALIFSAARLPRLLEEICWQFAAGLPAFSSLPFFSNSDPNLSAKLAPFSDPRQGPEKGSLSFFSRQCPNWGRVWGPNMGSRFGAQFWGPNLGPPSHAFLVAGLRATGLQ